MFISFLLSFFPSFLLPSVYLSIYLSIFLSFFLSIFWFSFYLSIYLSIVLSFFSFNLSFLTQYNRTKSNLIHFVLLYNVFSHLILSNLIKLCVVWSSLPNLVWIDLIWSYLALGTLKVAMCRTRQGLRKIRVWSSLLAAFHARRRDGKLKWTSDLFEWRANKRRGINMSVV